MSLCVNCNGKGRVCDRCGEPLPMGRTMVGDNDYCNDGDHDCWEKKLQSEKEYKERQARHRNEEP